MKKYAMLSSVFILASLFLGLSLADNPTIHVIGKGVVKVQADTTLITIGVESNNDNVTEAESEVQEKLNRTVDALMSAGLKREEISRGQASSFRMMQSRSCNTVNNTTTCAYSNLTLLERALTVQMKTTDQAKVDKVLQAAKGAGANPTMVNYVLSNPEQANEQALIKAAENARAKAEAFASGEGLRLGKILKKAEIMPWMCYLDDFTAFDLDSPSEDGKVLVRACVEVIYELIP